MLDRKNQGDKCKYLYSLTICTEIGFVVHSTNREIRKVNFIARQYFECKLNAFTGLYKPIAQTQALSAYQRNDIPRFVIYSEGK